MYSKDILLITEHDIIKINNVDFLNGGFESSNFVSRGQSNLRPTSNTSTEKEFPQVSVPTLVTQLVSTSE